MKKLGNHSGLVAVLILGALLLVSLLGMMRAFTSSSRMSVQAERIARLNDLRAWASQVLSCPHTTRAANCASPTPSGLRVIAGRDANDSIIINTPFQTIGVATRAMRVRVRCEGGFSQVIPEYQQVDPNGNFGSWVPLFWNRTECP